MTTLADFRTRAKSELGIAGASAERGFSDADLDQHISRVAEEFSLVRPIQARADVTVTGGTRTFLLTALTRPIRVAAVEYPIGQWPRALLDFDVWGDEVSLDHGPPGGNYSVRVYYEQKHLVDGAGSTVEAEHEHVIVVGACAYGLLARHAGAAQTQDSATASAHTMPHLRLGQEWYRRYQRLLDEAGRRRVRTRRFYVPATSPIGRGVVDWPA
jgi:hypothetical protein